MALQISAVPTTLQNQTSNVNRPTTDYHPTIWEDYFLCHISDSKTISTSICQQHEVLKEEVRKMLQDSMAMAPSQWLQLIDTIQRLGVAYHFEKEIEGALQEISSESYDGDDLDLYTSSLHFRLLRQQGFHVCCETFKKFKDNDGNFKARLIDDVQGMLGLYEAGHLGMRGEGILDEAIEFATTNLQSILTHLSPELVGQVRHALNRPIRKWLPRLDARHYIASYSEDGSHNKTLLKFANLDFNMVQKVHWEELDVIIEWWKILDVPTKFPYARDRVVECYFWIMGIYFEPQYSFGRKILTKIIATLSILDDTYDNYGTGKELEFLTEAIQRWDIKAADVLPENMKRVYDIVLDVYKELEHNMEKEGMLYAVKYAKEALKKVVQCYMVEARWREAGYVPSMEEHLEISLFEQKRNHVASTVECYMKQYGVSEEDATKFLRKEIANSWKDINEECLAPTPVSMALLERVLNLTRVMDVIYKDVDGYANPYILKDCIASLLKDPRPL